MLSIEEFCEEIDFAYEISSPAPPNIDDGSDIEALVAQLTSEEKELVNRVRVAFVDRANTFGDFEVRKLSPVGLAFAKIIADLYRSPR